MTRASSARNARRVQRRAAPKAMVLVVKVQVSLFDSDGVRRMLITARDGSTLYEGPADEAIVKKLDGAPKAYFDAIAEHVGHGKIRLGVGNQHPDQEQDW